MKVLIAGSRFITDYALLCELLAESGFVVTEVVSGREPTGVDALGERWADENRVPVAYFPADWKAHRGRSAYSNPAGMIRNRKMAEYCDAAVIIWDGQSPGTKDMIAEMRRHKAKPVIVHIVGKPRLKF